MGTLVFHILLFSAFLLAEVDIKGDVQEEELVIELADLMTEPEIPEEESVQEESEESMPTDPSSQLSETQSNRSNIASNRLAENEEFFDEDYTREVQEARDLVSDVNNQLSKETVKMEDIEMPVATTEGMDSDSIENVVYTGESNIVYYLKDRHHLSLPIPVYLAQEGGKVIVDIVVNREGKVIEAEPRNNPDIRDEQIYLYAKAAASRTVFNTKQDAPGKQEGTIHYTFVAQ